MAESRVQTATLAVQMAGPSQACLRLDRPLESRINSVASPDESLSAHSLTRRPLYGPHRALISLNAFQLWLKCDHLVVLFRSRWTVRACRYRPIDSDRFFIVSRLIGIRSLNGISLLTSKTAPFQLYLARSRYWETVSHRSIFSSIRLPPRSSDNRFARPHQNTLLNAGHGIHQRRTPDCVAGVD